MAITSTIKLPTGILNRASGSHLDDAGTPALLDLTLGFIPKYFAWHNVTDRISWEWFDGAADGTTLKTVAAGTRTLDTADVAITIRDTAADELAGIAGRVRIAAAAILQNKQYRWVAFG